LQGKIARCFVYQISQLCIAQGNRTGLVLENAKPAEAAGSRPWIGDIGKAVSISGQRDRYQASSLLDDEIAGSGLARAAINQDLIGDRLTFGELIDAGALDSADVDENVLAAVVGLDEAIALLRIKPLNFSGRHWTIPSRRK
jgi:hypothetical protein